MAPLGNRPRPRCSRAPNPHLLLHLFGCGVSILEVAVLTPPVASQGIRSYEQHRGGVVRRQEASSTCQALPGEAHGGRQRGGLQEGGTALGLSTLGRWRRKKLRRLCPACMACASHAMRSGARTVGISGGSPASIMLLSPLLIRRWCGRPPWGAAHLCNTCEQTA